jgi:hypothetical protein
MIDISLPIDTLLHMTNMSENDIYQIDVDPSDMLLIGIHRNATRRIDRLVNDAQLIPVLLYTIVARYLLIILNMLLVAMRMVDFNQALPQAPNLCIVMLLRILNLPFPLTATSWELRLVMVDDLSTTMPSLGVASKVV